MGCDGGYKRGNKGTGERGPASQGRRGDRKMLAQGETLGTGAFFLGNNERGAAAFKCQRGIGIGVNP